MDIEYRGFEITNTAGAEIIKISGGFKTGEWVYGYPLVNKVEGKSYIVTVTQNGGYVKHEVIPETLTQFIGLTDKNGNKIYRMDILKDTVKNFVGLVNYNDVIASFVGEISDTTKECYHYSPMNMGDVDRKTQLENTELIGTLWNQPEEYADKRYSAFMKVEDDFLKFAQAQEEAEAAGKEEFTCPLCGGKAYWGRAKLNGHLHMGCHDCKFRSLE